VLGQEVALKLVPLPPAGPSDPERLSRLMREARAGAAVDSPHVVRVLDAGVADGRPFLVMELVTGRSLEDLVREGPMVPQRAVELATQILAGLQAAHARGIVHRDMKPANVVVSSIPGSDGRQHDFAKILDFGIGKIRTASLGPATMPGTLLGTPGYMAPEQYVHAEDADHRADLYAVAAILFELLSGRLPFEGINPDSMKRQVLTQRPPSLQELARQVPFELAEVVDRGLARDPDGRWQSAEAFARALTGALKGERRSSLAATQNQATPIPLDGPTQPAPPPRFSRPMPQATTVRTKRFRRLLQVALVLGTAAGFGSGAMMVYLLMRSEPPPASAATPTPERIPVLEAPPDAAPAAQNEPAPEPAPEPEPEPPPKDPDLIASPGAQSQAPASQPSAPSKARAGKAGKRGKGARLDGVRIVGQLAEKAVQQLGERALASITSHCRPASGSATVEVTLHIHPPGKITLASAREGDRDLGQCVANELKAAVPRGWNPGEGASGIAIVKVTLVAP
jgi:serine/threonine-protein kinase